MHARLSVSDGGQVLARFDNGDPALVSVETGKGRVLVLASSADDSTNDLPVKAVYAPFWQQVLHYLENFRQEKPWMNVGDTIAPRSLLVEAAVRQIRRDRPNLFLSDGKKVKPQLRELLTGYGPLGVIWFDTPFTISREQSEELYGLVRKLQPDCIMNSRLGNGLGDLGLGTRQVAGLRLGEQLVDIQPVALVSPSGNGQPIAAFPGAQCVGGKSGFF